MRCAQRAPSGGTVRRAQAVATSGRQHADRGQGVARQRWARGARGRAGSRGDHRGARAVQGEAVFAVGHEADRRGRLVSPTGMKKERRPYLMVPREREEHAPAAHEGGRTGTFRYGVAGYRSKDHLEVV